MTVKRSDVLNVSKIDVKDIECEIDKQLEKPENIEKFKMWKVLIIPFYGYSVGNMDSEIREICDKYDKEGWDTDWNYIDDDVIGFTFK